MSLSSFTFADIMSKLVVPAFVATVRMVLIAGILATFFGFIIGIVLVVTEKDGLYENVFVNRVLDIIVNIIRSFPFIILIVSIIPLTRLIVGTSIGEAAAIVPLTIAASPFIGRIIQNALKEVDPSLIEAAKSFGASRPQIVFRIMFKESVPAIVSGLILAIINLLGATAMAGAVGAGGLGAVALTYGYQNFNQEVMYTICVILVIMVAFIQYFGEWIYRKLQ